MPSHPVAVTSSAAAALWVAVIVMHARPPGSSFGVLAREASVGLAVAMTAIAILVAAVGAVLRRHLPPPLVAYRLGREDERRRHLRVIR